MLVVDKDYFKSWKYITQDEFCMLWQCCLKVGYKPVTDIRIFKDSEKGKGKEVAEVAKYTVKSSHIMANLSGIADYRQDIQEEIKLRTNKITDEIVSVLDSVLKNRRLIEYGGVIKDKHKELNLTDDVNDDNADLIHTETDSIKNNSDYKVERYRWHIGLKNYVRIEDKENDGD
jgi:plasmid rolling circle replication initiator protein Rep